MNGKNKVNPSARSINVGMEFPAIGNFSCCDWVGEGEGFTVINIVGVGARVGVTERFMVGVFDGIDVEVGVILVLLRNIVGVGVLVGNRVFVGIWVGRVLFAINWGVTVNVGPVVILTFSLLVFLVRILYSEKPPNIKRITEAKIRKILIKMFILKYFT